MVVVEASAGNLEQLLLQVDLAFGAADVDSEGADDAVDSVALANLAYSIAVNVARCYGVEEGEDLGNAVLELGYLGAQVILGTPDAILVGTVGAASGASLAWESAVALQEQKTIWGEQLRSGQISMRTWVTNTLEGGGISQIPCHYQLGAFRKMHGKALTLYASSCRRGKHCESSVAACWAAGGWRPPTEGGGVVRRARLEKGDGWCARYGSEYPEALG